MHPIKINGKETKYLGVIVDANVLNVTCKKYPVGKCQYFHINYDYHPKHYFTSGGFALFFNEFGGRKKYPKEMQIIGCIKSDSMDEGVKVLIHSLFDLSYRDYCSDKIIGYEAYPFNTADESVRSLLTHNNIVLKENEQLVIIEKIN